MNWSTRAGRARWNPSPIRSRRWGSSSGRRSRRASTTCPLGRMCCAPSRFRSTQVRVLIVGQDPYPTPGHAVGLSFSVAPDVRPLPRSLDNIFKEYGTDLGLSRASHRRSHAVGRARRDAAQQGADRAAGHPGVASRQGLGGRHRMRDPGVGGAVAAVGRGAVGSRRVHAEADARRRALRGDRVGAPSPLSASRGFFGSRPFSRANELLEQMGAEPIDWRLP